MANTNTGMKRKQFTFYSSFLESARTLSKASDREKFLMAVIEYALEGKEPEKLPKYCQAAFAVVRPVLESSRRKAEAGSKGGSTEQAPSKQTESNGEANGKQTQANPKQEKGEGQEKGQEKEEVKEQLQQTGSTGLLQRLWMAYPANRRDSFAELCRTVRELALTENDILMACENLERWKKALDWTRDGGQYIPGLTKWLQSGKWVSPPPAAQLTSNPFLAIAMEDGCYEQG